jgi:hypothetical protein
MLDNSFLMIYHQNICGLRKTTDELISFLYPNFPHILCFSEHHLNQIELKQINSDSYILVANYCGQSFRRGGVCIFIHKCIKILKYQITCVL